ncbi:tetratricopeptide repeat protein [Silvibacterium dinghuense]|uniref:Tetratricopeptide repeat protein n=1 Tax=Silvibacterium dinghuense TaxID=1560006 RepID=A0A4V1NV46_9BACT|nr:outer membrane protein assembly factor BamD [Silvibacterium dinghuense]RXS94492.1 tetratricopeptide repeat protein [Silvibacterium dinghuense]
MRSLRTVLAPLPLALLLLASVPVLAQKRPPRIEMPKNGTMATIIRVGNLYAQADESSDRTGEVTPGRELVIVERSGKWLRVFANVDAPESRAADQPTLENPEEVQPISGWMLDKGVIDIHTPHGDQILFGEGVSAENAAAEPHPPPRAAQDARLLYRRVVEMFPESPITPEAMWRAADIRWQLEKADAATLPSAHEKESYLREQMDEDEMKKIEKYFPHTKWADFAAWDLIENQLCGDWQGSEKCPEKEANLYMKYADEHPDSPRAPQALYLAAWRMASAGDMWAADGNDDRAKEDRGRTMGITDHLQQKYPQSEYSARAADLAYKIQQGIPVYGSDRE